MLTEKSMRTELIPPARHWNTTRTGVVTPAWTLNAAVPWQLVLSSTDPARNSMP